MFVVTKDGRKFKLDDSELIEADEWHWPFKRGLVAVCDEDEFMEKVWIVSIQKNTKGPLGNREKEFELLAELEYDHEPTQEDLLYVYGAYGEGSYNTYLFVNEAYVHCYKEDK